MKSPGSGCIDEYDGRHFFLCHPHLRGNDNGSGDAGALQHAELITASCKEQAP
jgi:hypothetical protein